MAFLVDTNIFVDAHRRYYGFDIVPSFWGFLDQQFLSGHLVSIKPGGLFIRGNQQPKTPDPAPPKTPAHTTPTAA